MTAAYGHGAVSERYRSTVVAVEPEGLPVDVRISGGDQIRFENAGDEELVICGYESDGCEPWVRIGPDGVFEDRNSEAYFANAEADEYGTAPEDAGEGGPKFVMVREKPAFYAYHDHRVHWMGKDLLPPGIDENDPSVQKVFDGEVRFRYGDTDGVVRTRLDYVGGRSWLQRYGEYLLMGGAVAAMLAVFVVDARRRRRRAAAGPAVEPAAEEPSDG